MSAFPKFMVATNPMADLHGEYVYHTQKPRFLAKYTPENLLSHFDIVDDVDDMYNFFGGGENGAMKVAGLMRRLGDWRVAYCQWEEDHDTNNISDED